MNCSTAAAKVSAIPSHRNRFQGRSVRSSSRLELRMKSAWMGNWKPIGRMGRNAKTLEWGSGLAAPASSIGKASTTVDCEIPFRFSSRASLPIDNVCETRKYRNSCVVVVPSPVVVVDVNCETGPTSFLAKVTAVPSRSSVSCRSLLRNSRSRASSSANVVWSKTWPGLAGRTMVVQSDRM
ncbi:hypothetical protein D3C87_1484050 [compost metagenome]